MKLEWIRLYQSVSLENLRLHVLNWHVLWNWVTWALSRFRKFSQVKLTVINLAYTLPTHRSSPLQMFFKTKFLKFHRKTPVLGSLFNKVAGFLIYNFIKNETAKQMFSIEISEVFKNTFFDITPPVAASLHGRLARTPTFF